MPNEPESAVAVPGDLPFLTSLAAHKAEVYFGPSGLFDPFPPVNQVSVRSTTQFGHFAVDEVPCPPLPVELVGAVPQRRAEYWLGRWCALNALQASGHRLQCWLPYGQHGPAWPPGWLGTITHTRGLASAAVVSSGLASGIGIDAERIANDEIVEILRETVLIRDEMLVCERAAAQAGLRPNVAATLAFSAKESLFKAYYRHVGYIFGFECARLIALDFRARTLKLRLAKDLAPDFKRGTVVAGRLTLTRQYVHTAVVLTRGRRAVAASEGLPNTEAEAARTAPSIEAVVASLRRGRAAPSGR